MKKIIILVIALVIIGAVIWRFNSGPAVPTDNKNDVDTTVPTSQTVKVSDKLSEYKNDELGFAVKYPTTWEKIDSPNNVTFIAPTVDNKEKNTVNKIESKIDVFSGKCTFPLVTSVKERDVLKSGDLSFNMISISNTVQGRNYFNRMYSLQKDSICYYFTLSTISLSPTSKGYAGAEAQQIGARNVTLVDTADSQFKDLVKSFAFVVGPAGQDETKVSPKK